MDKNIISLHEANPDGNGKTAADIRASTQKLIWLTQKVSEDQVDKLILDYAPRIANDHREAAKQIFTDQLEELNRALEEQDRAREKFIKVVHAAQRRLATLRLVNPPR